MPITGAGRGIGAATARLLAARGARVVLGSRISSTRDPAELAALTARRYAIAMPPEAAAETIAFGIAQPASVDVGEIVVRPTVQP
jgi:NADP-dependent 3-hydroxy acid dehydrogenase YdfG